jgi:hypothetical protein
MRRTRPEQPEHFMRKTWNSIVAACVALALAGLAGSSHANATDMAQHHGKHRAKMHHGKMSDQHRQHMAQGMAQHRAMMMKMHGGKMDHAAMMTMHAKHHGPNGKMTAEHRRHMAAMMRMHGGKGGKMDHAMMMKMHAIHGVKMGGGKMHAMSTHAKPNAAAKPPTAAKPMKMAMAAAKPAGSCGTYMYRKAGACLDARMKK